MNALLATLLLMLSISSSFGFVVKPRSTGTPALATPSSSSPPLTTDSSMARYIFNKKKSDEDLSDIESRDMTRKEMEEYNKQSEDIMNAELWGMTFFSLVLSIPMFYLVWVGFFADTAGIDESLDITY